MDNVNYLLSHRNEVNEIVSGELIIHDKLRISASSVFGDDTWTWVDDENERLEFYSMSRLAIYWREIQQKYKFSDTLIRELKIFSFLRYTNPAYAFQNNGNRKNKTHASTIVGLMKALAPFIGHLQRILSVGEYSLIDSLSDIDVQDLREALLNYPYKHTKQLRSGLTLLSSFVLGKFLDGGEVNWNAADIALLPWKISSGKFRERIPNALFRLISNEATRDIKHFLEALEIDWDDKTPIGNCDNTYLLAHPNFKEVFEEYVISITNFRKQSEERPKGHSKFKYKMGKLRPLNGLVDRARKAAQIIIAMYTGARPSELNSFRVGCLCCTDDGWVIKGTVIKHRDLESPTRKDEWVAIPIVRDAIKLLEQTCRLVESNLIFHASVMSAGGKKRSGDKSSSYSRWFRGYINIIDASGEWQNFKITTYNLRHTLVYQMRRAGLNLPYITFQLKHKYDVLSQQLSDVTLLYGSIGSDAVKMAIEEANDEYYAQLYHPDALIIGGGAKDLRARCKSYFLDVGSQGKETDQILRDLAKIGIPLTDVGLGLCRGQLKIVIDGVEEDPPCIRQLRCNPLRCANGVIPEFKLPFWKGVAKTSRLRAFDPEFSHAAAYHTEVADEADAVVQYFLEKIKKRGVLE